MIKIAPRNGSDVSTTENANFECLGIAFYLGHFGTSLGKVIQSLKDDPIGAKIFTNCSMVFAMGYHLFGRR
jgi:hypothetical protein